MRGRTGMICWSLHQSSTPNQPVARRERSDKECGGGGGGGGNLCPGQQGPDDSCVEKGNDDAGGVGGK